MPLRRLSRSLRCQIWNHGHSFQEKKKVEKKIGAKFIVIPFFIIVRVECLSRRIAWTYNEYSRAEGINREAICWEDMEIKEEWQKRTNTIEYVQLHYAPNWHAWHISRVRLQMSHLRWQTKGKYQKPHTLYIGNSEWNLSVFYLP